MTQHVDLGEIDLQTLLRHCDVTEIRAVELARSGNQIVLRGIVGSFYHKQLAQELIKGRAKDVEIENLICVEYVESEYTSDFAAARASDLDH